MTTRGNGSGIYAMRIALIIRTLLDNSAKGKWTSTKELAKVLKKSKLECHVISLRYYLYDISLFWDIEERESSKIREKEYFINYDNKSV